MKPIPKKLLIHDVMYHRQIKAQDFYEESTLDPGTPISFIRMEPMTKVIRDKNRAEVQLSAVLFYDCKNSRPKGIKFETDDVIVFNGEFHKIQIIEPLYDSKRLHHYELGLIKHA